MIPKLQIFLIISSLLFTGIIVNMLRKEMIDLKYSFTWILSGICIIILAVKPEIAFSIAGLIGIIEPVNAIFLISIFFTIIITFSLTVALSRQSVRMRKLAQEVALLENALKEKEKPEKTPR